MNHKDKITEQPSHFNHLEQMSVTELLHHINEEDALVAEAVQKAIPQVADWVIAVIAGGDEALRHAVEKAEDDARQGWQDLLPYQPTADDTVIGIAASGTTPYVVGALQEARSHGLLTGCITSNPHTPLAEVSDCPVETIVGPEFVTGSSRMKSGTAQKMVLNMISTTLMIRLGRVKDNRMVKMQLTNAKLLDRGTRMIQESLGIPYDEAEHYLLEAGSVDRALKMSDV